MEMEKSRAVRVHTSAIKPDLTVNNKLLRLRFSLEALEVDRIMKVLRFRSMYNTIHIDEKWFYMSKTTHRFYMTPEEADPHRTCKSKSYIPKIMFMCAVARPIFGADGEVLFDGKIGIFPLIQKVPAKRNSKNRPAWTLLTKPIQSITQQVTKDYLINQMLPVIMLKWPPWASNLTFIQQDNAKPHIKNDDPEFRAAASSNGFDIRLVQQPPNSLDTNILDLGWFRAIQTIQYKTVCYNFEQLVDAVVSSFENLDPTRLNNVFLSLQGCMVEIMKVKGQNRYKIPHMDKEALIRQNALPIDLEVSDDLVRECIIFLLQAGIVEGIGGLMDYLGIPHQQQQVMN